MHESGSKAVERAAAWVQLAMSGMLGLAVGASIVLGTAPSGTHVAVLVVAVVLLPNGVERLRLLATLLPRATR